MNFLYLKNQHMLKFSQTRSNKWSSPDMTLWTEWAPVGLHSLHLHSQLSIFEGPAFLVWKHFVVLRAHGVKWTVGSLHVGQLADVGLGLHTAQSLLSSAPAVLLCADFAWHPLRELASEMCKRISFVIHGFHSTGTLKSLFESVWYVRFFSALSIKY